MKKIYNFITYSKILKIGINMIKTKCEGKKKLKWLTLNFTGFGAEFEEKRGKKKLSAQNHKCF